MLVFEIIIVVAIIFGIDNLSKQQKKLEKENTKLQNTINSQNDKFDDVLAKEKKDFKIKVQKMIVNEKELFTKTIKESFETFSDDLVFEFSIDKSLGKSEFVSLKKIIDEKKDRYAYFFNLLLTKHYTESEELKKLVSTFDKLNKEYEQKTVDIDKDIRAIRSHVKEHMDLKKEGKKYAKEFSQRLDNIEEVVFEQVMATGDNSEYEESGGMLGELEKVPQLKLNDRYK